MAFYRFGNNSTNTLTALNISREKRIFEACHQYAVTIYIKQLNKQTNGEGISLRNDWCLFFYIYLFMSLRRKKEWKVKWLLPFCWFILLTKICSQWQCIYLFSNAFLLSFVSPFTLRRAFLLRNSVRKLKSFTILLAFIYFLYISNFRLTIPRYVWILKWRS